VVKSAPLRLYAPRFTLYAFLLSSPIPIDAAIIGGGIAGLWTLDALVKSGRSAVLIERTALGDGQTIWSQGIIHSGLKYTLAGLMSRSARAIRDMPERWSKALRGTEGPDLRAANLRAAHCWLWQTDSISSQAGMIGARAGLAVAPVVVEREDRPQALRACAGVVARLDEPVLDVASVLRALAAAHHDRIIRADAAFESHDGTGPIIRLGDALRFQPRWVILAAGNGSGAIRESLGLPAKAMQVRPLRMVMVRGKLPELSGHCVDGAATRVTITSASHSSGDTVWQIGGQIAELGGHGPTIEPDALLAHAVREIRAVVPGVDLTGCAWATYDAPRAEGRTPTGRRPSGPVIVREGRILSVWPTKLALAPAAADMVLETISTKEPPIAFDAEVLADRAAHPDVASPPWEHPDGVWRATESLGHG